MGSNLEDFYPLSPAQQGILFHTLCAPQSGMYYEQLSCTLHGRLNTALFRQAWQAASDRHPILRTAFVWEGIKEPVQVVHRQVTLPWQEYDWQNLSVSEQQAQLEHFLKTDQEQGFNLTQAPLMRFTLIRLDEQTYTFVWSHHHLLLDGWSTPLLLKEVLADYHNPGQSRLQPRPYRDYIAWIQQQNLSEAEAFWRQKLQGFSAPTPIGLHSGCRSAVSTTASYNEQHVQLSTATTTALQSFARQHQLTLNTLIQGAWAVLLSRYSGTEDIVFGAAVSGRPPTLAGSEDMVGLFINTLPVRVNVSEALLLPWLQQLQAQQAEARQYEYSPLVEVQGWSEVPRGLPLFESVVVFENYPVDAALQTQEPSLNISNVRAFEKTNYPLTVIVFPGSVLGLKILYDEQRFDAAAIARMLGHLQTLLENMVDPHQCLSRLPLLTQAERNQQLEWNNTQVEYPNQCIHELFEAQVDRAPDAIAIVDGDQSFTYRELNQQANQFARYLQRVGVAPEGLVGVCLERSAELVVTLLGILKAGGAYVPLDPTYPQERLAWMVEDAQVSVLVTRSTLASKLPVHTAQLVCLDTNQTICQEPEQNLGLLVTPDQLAYVLYTSGSTGTPKGVMGLHRGAVNRLVWNPYPFTPHDVCCQKTSLNFVDSVWEIFAPLIQGVRSVLLPDAVVKNPLQFVQTLAEQQVTRLVLVPSLLRILLDFPNLQDCLPKLKYWISSGEPLTIELCQRFQQQLPHAILLNLYGSSEVAADATWHDVSTSQFTDCVPIGRAIANTQIYILDLHLQPVAIGVSGELYIGGAGLARGYWNRPDLTVDRFIPNPFAAEDQRSPRLYKTGDLGCFLPNGAIKYLGRTDHQVKLRGMRIETGEIETWLNQHSAVQNCVVVVREDASGNCRLVAYVALKAEHKGLSNMNLQAFLKEKLPEYMVPTAFVYLDELPLTPNGKVDRHALPEPNTSQLATNSPFVPPQTPIEAELAEIWTAILGLKQVGIHDNFFHLGGHSLLAMQLVSRVSRQFKVDLTLPDFFANATIEALAATIEAMILAKSNPDDLERLLSQLETMNETEVETIAQSHSGVAESRHELPSP